jgi:hypothetical protein
MELQAMQTVLKRLQREYESILPSCKTCEKYQAEKCIEFGAEPPPDWVSGAVPCTAWKYDSIPF